MLLAHSWVFKDSVCRTFVLSRYQVSRISENSIWGSEEIYPNILPLLSFLVPMKQDRTKYQRSELFAYNSKQGPQQYSRKEDASQHVEDLGSNGRLGYRCACKNLPGSVGTPQCRSWVARPSLQKRQHLEYRQSEVLPRMGSPHCEASHFRPVQRGLLQVTESQKSKRLSLFLSKTFLPSRKTLAANLTFGLGYGPEQWTGLWP